MTYSGKYIFATSCGILCAILRIVLDFPGGIGVAIITMNFFTPFINKRGPLIKFMERNFNEKNL